MRKKLLSAALLGCCLVGGTSATPTLLRAQDAPAAAPAADGWASLFDGKTLNGWNATEHPESFKVEDGNLVVNGERGHLYYVGDGAAQPFVNFEFKAEVMTFASANSGVYIHTQPQKDGWPHFGYECQVNSTHSDPIKTGSLYNVVDVWKVNDQEAANFKPSIRIDKDRTIFPVREAPSKDGEWFTYEIKVEGKRVTTKVNGQTLVDYTEPDGKKPGGAFTRVLDKGTFAIQAHDPKSRVQFRNIMVKRLP